MNTVSFNKLRPTDLVGSLSPSVQRCVLAAQERGASAWVTALLLAVHGFSLHKSAFRDSLCLRYGWPLALVPSTCACGAKFDSDHALICRYGGYPTLHHNEVRDLTASLLHQVCSNVATEPHFQPVTGEAFPPSTNTRADARLDVRARGFWANDDMEAFLMFGFFTHLPPVIVVPQSPPSIANMNIARRQNMLAVSWTLNVDVSPLWF